MTAPYSDGFGKNEYYAHVYNKGVENRNLFNDTEDYQVFLGYLKEYLTAPSDQQDIKKVFTVNGRSYQGIPHQLKNYFEKVDLLAYRLMPDNFHLVVNQRSKGSLEKLIRSLCTRYVIYYNKKYNRTGSLFQGPFKSVQIPNLSQLVFLTHYLHHPLTKNYGDTSIGYSSYPEYLGTRETPWVETKAIMSSYDNLANDSLKDVGSYKQFIENYELNQNEKQILGEIILENETQQLKRPTPTYAPQSIITHRPEPNLPSSHPSTAKFFTAVSGVFVLLVILGIRNIRISTAQSNNNLSSITPTPVSAVSGVKTDQPPDTSTPPSLADPRPEITDALNLTTTPEVTETIMATPEVKHLFLIIKIDDESNSIKVRKEPTITSEILAEVKDGDTFEFVAKISGWYQIKLANGLDAFVLPKYAQLEEEANQ